MTACFHRSGGPPGVGRSAKRLGGDEEVRGKAYCAALRLAGHGLTLPVKQEVSSSIILSLNGRVPCKSDDYCWSRRPLWHLAWCKACPIPPRHWRRPPQNSRALSPPPRKAPWKALW